MRDIIIISAFIDTLEKEDVLLKSITQLKKLNKTIFLFSSSEISNKITNLVDYYFWNKENPILPIEMSPFVWIANNNYFVHLFSNSNILAVSRAINLSLNFCKDLGYEFFYFIEFDAIFDNKDLNLFEKLKQKTLENDKKAFLFKTKMPFSEDLIYETRFFGGIIDFFPKRICLPIDLETWKRKYFNENYLFTESLEKLFYVELSKYESEFEIFDGYVKDFFKNSEIDCVSVFKKVYIIYNEDDPNLPVIFLRNGLERFSQFEIFYNDKLVKIINLITNDFICEFIPMDILPLKIKVLQKTNDKPIETFEKEINLKNITELKNNGFYRKF